MGNIDIRNALGIQDEDDSRTTEAGALFPAAMSMASATSMPVTIIPHARPGNRPIKFSSDAIRTIVELMKDLESSAGPDESLENLQRSIQHAVCCAASRPERDWKIMKAIYMVGDSSHLGFVFCFSFHFTLDYISRLMRYRLTVEFKALE
jgi:hypothetical protein